MDDHGISGAPIRVACSAVVTPLGATIDAVESLLAGCSAVTSVELFDCKVSLAQFPDRSWRSPKILAEKLIAQLPDCSAYNTPETLVVFAAAKGSLESIESSECNPEQSLLQNQGRSFAEQCGFDKTDLLVVSNACASGIAAVDTARDYLLAGLYDQVVILGYDLISQFTITGFHALSAISPTGALPFDANRSGMSLGEGAGILVLDRKISKLGDIQICGSATTNDANHRTGPSRDGSGLATAVVNALRESSISADQIGAVKCHGTATPYNDAMESKALFTVFGDRQPPIVSFKGNMGHLSGAGSLIELILAQEFLKRKLIPGTFGFQNSESEIPLRLSSLPQTIHAPTIVVLAAGFGGLNACAVLEEVQ